MSVAFPVLEMCALLDFTSVLAYLLVCSASLNIAQTLDFTCILAINLVYLQSIDTLWTILTTHFSS